jgi:hypothetical protein
MSIVGKKSLLHSKSPRLGYQSVSDTWGLAKIVRKVEFKLLQINRSTPLPAPSPSLLSCQRIVYAFVPVSANASSKSPS